MDKSARRVTTERPTERTQATNAAAPATPQGPWSGGGAIMTYTAHNLQALWHVPWRSRFGQPTAPNRRYWCPAGSPSSTTSACAAGRYGTAANAKDYTDNQCEGACNTAGSVVARWGDCVTFTAHGVCPAPCSGTSAPKGRLRLIRVGKSVRRATTERPTESTRTTNAAAHATRQGL